MGNPRVDWGIPELTGDGDRDGESPNYETGDGAGEGQKILESPWGSPIPIGDGDGDVNRFPDGDGDGDGMRLRNGDRDVHSFSSNLSSTVMAGYDLSEAYVLKKLHKEKIKEPEKERGEKCITNDDEYKNASPRKCLCWKVKKDRAIFNAQSMKPTEDLVTWELKKV
ncbi:hypothetical protein Tco_0799176 [Tanacetum coccineum]